MLGLRTDRPTPVDGNFHATIDGLATAGLVEFADGFARPTRRGMDLHNQVALAIL
jgi:hypothetical protein